MELQSNGFLTYMYFNLQYLICSVHTAVSQYINKFCAHFISCQLHSVVLAVQEESLSALNYACDCT